MAKHKKGFWGLFARGKQLSLRRGGEVVTTPVQKDMRLRIAEFENARVDDVMIPRAEIIGVELSTSLPNLIRIYSQEAHSRLPVYRETLDDPVGVIHIRDVVSEIARNQGVETQADERPLERLRRDLLFVPPSMPLTDLLVKMQASRMHLALVVDEYGGTDGLVSLEDLVEEIVGDIADEHDENVAMLIRRGRRTWEVDARMETGDFSGETGLNLALAEHEVDTLGGIAFALAGRVPLRGEILSHPGGFGLEVLDSDARRIYRLIVRQPAPETRA